MNTQIKHKAWSNEDVLNWRAEQKIQRSYEADVLSKVQTLKERFEVTQYGELNYEGKKYPLYFVQTKEMDANKPNILITGGVHGYETSGVHGALQFMNQKAAEYEKNFNLVCVPCVSPWGYETINRWNPDAIDPNRNFYADSPAQECAQLYTALKNLNLNFQAHFDLHETTDTDNTVFRPALEKRDGIEQDLWEIPDGFYVVGDTGRNELGFQKMIIEHVEKVTHIAPSDESGKLIGVDALSPGIINYDVKKLHLCAGLTDAKFVTTTEVYPDSPKVTDTDCNHAQVAAVSGGLNYIEKMV